MTTKIDLTGQTFGELTVLREDGRGGACQVKWLCSCSCGNQVSVLSSNLRRKQRSCGCLVRTRGGNSGTPEYEAWRNMIRRCYEPTHVSYADYGARGIEVCARWRESFAHFLTDVGPRPVTQEGRTSYSLDRVNNDGHYEPDNVRWATWTEQHNNRRGNRLVTHDDETRTLAEWAAITGLGRATIAYRLDSGWSVENALSRKPHPGKSAERVS